MKKLIPRRIKYSKISHSCFIACIVLGLISIDLGGAALTLVGIAMVAYSFIIDRLVFKRFKIGFYTKPQLMIHDGPTIDVEWKFVKEGEHDEVRRTQHNN